MLHETARCRTPCNADSVKRKQRRTLRHYIIISQLEADGLYRQHSEDRSHSLLRNPSFICLNPSVDNIYMEFWHLFDKTEPSCNKLISTIRAQFSRQFGRIHKLHVYNCAWNEGFIRNHCNSTGTWRSCLELFRNLEEVRIISIKKKHERQILFAKIENAKAGLSRWFERYAEREHGYKVPKVLVSASSNTVVDVVDRSTFMSLSLLILAIFFGCIAIEILIGLGSGFFADNSPHLI
jgi:hypothetical protein